MRKVWWALLYLLFVLALAACNPASAPQQASTQPRTSSVISHGDPQESMLLPATPTPPMSIPSQKLTPTPKAGPSHGSPSPGCVTFSHDTTRVPAKNGGLAAPYGSAPTSTLAKQFTTQLLQLINHDRAACGLPAFIWSQTLANGALLHSWNMFHCGFSHTCPDGMTQCQRIANEGFAGQTDCGECIGGAGGSWASVVTIQEGMAHESVTGWHRIHLFSTTLRYIGVGVYIDPSGYVWFTEDMVS